MKNLLLIALLAAILYSCQKDGTKGCISQNTALPALSSATDKDSVQALITRNHISTNGLAFYRYTYLQAPGGPVNEGAFFQYAYALQVRNGLPVFLSDISYSFLNGSLTGVSGKVYGKTTLDTRPGLSLSSVRQLAISEIVNKQGIDPKFKDSCYVAQFGYYNLNILSTTDTTTKFVKAWTVRPAHSQFPQVYIRDDNGATAYFDSGIRPLDAKKKSVN